MFLFSKTRRKNIYVTIILILVNLIENILRKGDDDNGLLPFICKLNKKEDVDEEENWTMANPSLPYMPDLLVEIRKEYREWKKNPERLPAFMQKRMNLPDTVKESAAAKWDDITNFCHGKRSNGKYFANPI
jgi:phage terminase large subunit-like protein